MNQATRSLWNERSCLMLRAATRHATFRKEFLDAPALPIALPIGTAVLDLPVCLQTAEHKKIPARFPGRGFLGSPAYSPLALRARDQISV